MSHRLGELDRCLCDLRRACLRLSAMDGCDADVILVGLSGPGRGSSEVHFVRDGSDWRVRFFGCDKRLHELNVRHQRHRYRQRRAA